jgi:hypothetical protein
MKLQAQRLAVDRAIERSTRRQADGLAGDERIQSHRPAVGDLRAVEIR